MVTVDITDLHEPGPLLLFSSAFLGKSRLRQRSRNPQSKVNSGAVSTANLDILATASGVTTRLQREQLQKQEPLPSVATECDSHQTFMMDSTLLIPR